MSKLTVKNFSINNCQKYLKKEIQDLVEELGLSTSGTKEEMCKRIDKFLEGDIPKSSKSNKKKRVSKVLDDIPKSSKSNKKKREIIEEKQLSLLDKLYTLQKQEKIDELRKISLEERAEVAEYLVSDHTYNKEKFNKCQTVLECIMEDFKYEEGDKKSIELYQKMVRSIEPIIDEHHLIKDYIKKYKKQKLDINIHKEDMESMCCICDEKFISNVLEQIYLESVGDHDELIYGFSISEKKSIKSIIVVNLDSEKIRQSSQIKDEISNKDNKDICEIGLVCRNKNYTGKGETTILLHFVILWCRLLGKKYIYLFLAHHEDNDVARKFYIKNGFTPLGIGEIFRMKL